LETIHEVWVDLEIVMRNFRKISPRPPWSIFIITQKPRIIFKSNQSHWKANKILYNFHVYTENQFKTETCEKDTRMRNREFCPVQLATASDLLATASYDSPVSGKTSFSPQNSNFDFPKLKFDPKVCLNISKHEKTLNSI
jgi:hypothetical protein